MASAAVMYCTFVCATSQYFCIVVSVSAQCSLQPGLGELIHKFVEGACAVLVLCTAPCHSGGGRESTENHSVSVGKSCIKSTLCTCFQKH